MDEEKTVEWSEAVRKHGIHGTERKLRNSVETMGRREIHGTARRLWSNLKSLARLDL